MARRPRTHAPARYNPLSGAGLTSHPDSTILHESIRLPAPHHQLQLTLSAEVPIMMQQLVQQWEQCSMQWIQYGFQPMQQYQIPMYACPPHEHCGEPIDTQDAEWKLVGRMPPGLGTKQHEAYELSPHDDLNDRGTTGVRLTATAAVLQKVGDEDIGFEPFSNIIIRLSPLSSPMSQATKTPRTPLSWDCSTPSPSPEMAPSPEATRPHAIQASDICSRETRRAAKPPDFFTPLEFAPPDHPDGLSTGPSAQPRRHPVHSHSRPANCHTSAPPLRHHWAGSLAPFWL